MHAAVRCILGFLLLVVGIIGVIVPIVPSFPLIAPGLVLLAPETPPAQWLPSRPERGDNSGKPPT